MPSEKGSKVFRRSLYVVQDVREGEELNGSNVRAIRPGYGLPPKHLDSVVGKRATRHLIRGEPLSFEMISG
jgi:N-acetylneuraminate synthase